MNTDAADRTGPSLVGRLRRAFAQARGERFGQTFGTFMVGVWLVFLLEPAAAAWQLPNHFRGAVGILALLTFAASYLRVFFTGAYAAFAGEPRRADGSSRGRLLSQYVVCAALAAASTLIIGQTGTVTWVFFSVAGLWVWSFWRAIIVSLALSGLYLVLQYEVSGWSTDYSLLFAMLLAMVAAGGGMLASRRGHDLDTARQENALLLVEEERNRMARDLHDILGHSLTVITVKAELAGRLMEAGDDRARQEVADLERLSRSALSDVRRAVEGYREISLSGELIRAREALAAAGVEADLPRALDEVPEDLQEVFAWTVREGVTNVVRHSAAHTCAITVDGTSITIRDDGRGAAVGLTGNGLRGLRERAAAAGAQLVTRTLEPHGFEVRVLARTEDQTTKETATVPRARSTQGGEAPDMNQPRGASA